MLSTYHVTHIAWGLVYIHLPKVYTLYLHSHSPYILSVESQIFLQLIEISKLECLIWLQPFIAKFFVLIMVWCCRCCSSVNRTLILVDRSYWIFNINILGTELRLVLILGTNHFQTRGPKCKNRFFCALRVTLLFIRCLESFKKKWIPYENIFQKMELFM